MNTNFNVNQNTLSFQNIPTELLIHTYSFFDLMDCVNINEVSKLFKVLDIDPQILNSVHSHFCKKLSERVKLTINCDVDNFLIKLTQILEKKVPRNCDIHEWLKLYVVSNDKEIFERGQKFIQNSQVSRHDLFECLKFDISSINKNSKPDLYLGIDISSNEDPLVFNKRSEGSVLLPKSNKISFVFNKYVLGKVNHPQLFERCIRIGHATNECFGFKCWIHSTSHFNGCASLPYLDPNNAANFTEAEAHFFALDQQARAKFENIFFISASIRDSLYTIKTTYKIRGENCVGRRELIRKHNAFKTVIIFSIAMLALSFLGYIYTKN